jgi:hypothetical protein
MEELGTDNTGDVLTPQLPFTPEVRTDVADIVVIRLGHGAVEHQIRVASGRHLIEQLLEVHVEEGLEMVGVDAKALSWPSSQQRSLLVRFNHQESIRPAEPLP